MFRWFIRGRIAGHCGEPSGGSADHQLWPAYRTACGVRRQFRLPAGSVAAGQPVPTKITFVVVGATPSARRVLLVVAFGYLLASWAMNPVSAILPTITTSLGIDVARAGWVMNAYFVLLVGGVLIAGRLSAPRALAGMDAETLRS